MAEDKKEYTPEEIAAWLDSGDGPDLTDTEDQAYDAKEIAPFPKGNRDFIIVGKPTLRKADSGSLGLYNMDLKVDVDGHDRHVWTNIWIHPNTIKQVKAFLLCVGLRDRKISAKEIYTEEFAEELVGMSGNAYFDIDPNPGYKPKNVLKYWNNEFAKARRNTAPEGEGAKPLLAAKADDMPF